MEQPTYGSPQTYREQWLALLEKNGVGHPKALRVVEVPGGLVQATVGEPGGQLSLEGAPGNVLMFNVSPVQRLRQVREGRSFTNDMLHGEMTLMPRGVPSQWSWNSACDRLDVVVFDDALADASMLDVVDHFLFRDAEMEAICRRLYRELSLGGMADRLCVELLVVHLARLLQERHSVASGGARTVTAGGLTRNQARRVLEYIECNLTCEVRLRGMADVVDLTPYHFARSFKRTIGVAPHRYLVERRVERAKTLLRTTRASLLEIGLSTGFCDQSHFTTTFRRMVGATPARFQECT